MTEQHSEMCDSAQSYWVVIPAYNEAATVGDVAGRARQHCPNVIVVDDGSTDETAQALAGLDITVLRNDVNLGKAGSLWRGFEQALAQGALGVITLDADGQHVPEEIPILLAAAARHPTVLIIGARRRSQRKAAFWRYKANRFADFWISWAAGQWVDDSQSGFRLYPAVLVKTLRLRHDRSRSFVFESEVVIEAARQDVRCVPVPISAMVRPGPRASHFRPVADIARIALMVAGKLLAKGFSLRGLYRSLVGMGTPPVEEECGNHSAAKLMNRAR